MSQGIAASLDPIYGPILGYALDPGNGTFPTIAARVTLRPTGHRSVSNIDADIAYSAVGFGIKAFPPVPYSFPKGTQNPIGRQIGSNQLALTDASRRPAPLPAFSVTRNSSRCPVPEERRPSPRTSATSTATT